MLGFQVLSLSGAECRMVAETVAALGGLDIAVNNAGVNKNNAAEDTPEHEWDLTFNVNTKGLFLCCQVPPAGTYYLEANVPVLPGAPRWRLRSRSECSCAAL